MKQSVIRALLCLAAGGLSSLGMAPHNFWFILFATIGGFYYLLSSAPSMRVAALYGFLFSFGYFFFSLSWIGNALLVEGNDYKWAYPLALCGLPLLLTAFFIPACMIVHRFFDLRTLPGYFGFAAVFSLFEWVRGTLVLGGFPWNTFGYGWAGVLEMVQLVWLDDVYLLTLLTLFWCALPGFLFASEGRTAKIGLTAGVLVTLAASYAYGAYRLAHYIPAFHEDVEVRVVQPNIPQGEKWTPEKFEENLEKHIALSRADSNAAGTAYIIWPETSLNFRYLSDEISVRHIRGVLDSYDGKAYLLSGFFRYYPEERVSYNSLVMIDQAGRVSNIYDKHHLVPFGEYIPLQKWIPLTPVATFFGFTPGPGPQTMTTPEGLRYSPLICYEVIFPHLAADRDARPDFLLNVANDAWYGISAGPYQHHTQGIFRAIELGIPLIRSTSTGVSAVVDPMGRVLEQSALFESDLIVSRLPLALKLSQNAFIFLKGKVFLILCLVFMMVGLLPQRAII